LLNYPNTGYETSREGAVGQNVELFVERLRVRVVIARYIIKVAFQDISSITNSSSRLSCWLTRWKFPWAGLEPQSGHSLPKPFTCRDNMQSLSGHRVDVQDRNLVEEKWGAFVAKSMIDMAQVSEFGAVAIVRNMSSLANCMRIGCTETCETQNLEKKDVTMRRHCLIYCKRGKQMCSPLKCWNFEEMQLVIEK
jgi:hypothetical protein